MSVREKMLHPTSDNGAYMFTGWPTLDDPAPNRLPNTEHHKYKLNYREQYPNLNDSDESLMDVLDELQVVKTIEKEAGCEEDFIIYV